MSETKFHFSWDLAKSTANFSKHRVRFGDSIAVFDDPFVMTRPSLDHGAAEERWISIGQSDSALLAVVHPLEEWDDGDVLIRIISSRRITADERRQYESGQCRIEEAIMRTEHDDPKWERGKLYREDAIFMLPFHLEESVFRRITRLAGSLGVPAADLAAELLTRGMDELDAQAAPHEIAERG
jgi:uncharacterized DUF497 family protein